MTTPLAAVILAGGASRRMGRDKATMTFTGPSGDTTFVEQAVAVDFDEGRLVVGPGEGVAEDCKVVGA